MWVIIFIFYDSFTSSDRGVKSYYCKNMLTAYLARNFFIIFAACSK